MITNVSNWIYVEDLFSPDALFFSFHLFIVASSRLDGARAWSKISINFCWLKSWRVTISWIFEKKDASRTSSYSIYYLFGTNLINLCICFFFNFIVFLNFRNFTIKIFILFLISSISFAIEMYLKYNSIDTCIQLYKEQSFIIRVKSNWLKTWSN